MLDGTTYSGCKMSRRARYDIFKMQKGASYHKWPITPSSPDGAEFWILTSHLFTLFNTFSDVWRIPSRIPWLLLLTLPWLFCLRRDFLESSSVLEFLSNVDVLETSPSPSCPSSNCWRTTSRPSTTAGKPDSFLASESVFFQKKSVTLGCNWAKLTPPRNSLEIIEC